MTIRRAQIPRRTEYDRNKQAFHSECDRTMHVWEHGSEIGDKCNCGREKMRALPGAGYKSIFIKMDPKKLL